MQGKKGHRAHGQSRKCTGEGRAVQGEAGIAENARADSRDEAAAGHSHDGQDHGGDKALQGKLSASSRAVAPRDAVSVAV